jgi:hypothetical protein
MQLKRRSTFVLICLGIAWAWDQLFWEQAFGLNFFLWVTLLVAGGLLFTRQQEEQPDKRALLLLIPIAFFSAMAFVRLEPLTSFLNVVATLLLLGLFAHTYRGGRWLSYELSDYLRGAFSVALDALSRQVIVFNKQQKPAVAEEGETKSSSWNTAFGLLRGLLLAIPVLLIFTLLLSEADPIFEQAVEDVFEFFRIENIVEFIWRGVWISILAYLLSGVYLHALRKDNDEKLINKGEGWQPRFLGFTEAAVVLGLVNLLFISFVIIQFQYFFGGQQTLILQDLTYAEYARRGFGELVTVAFFALLMYTSFSSVTKREASAQQKGFSAMGVLLVLLIGVMLVSSWQRLLLYENAFGFTRLRTYTHVFIPWLGLLLAAVVVLELVGRQRRLALVMLIAGLGFVASLNIVNVDAFITVQNLARDHDETITDNLGRDGGQQTDIYYLSTLSADALPAMARAFNAATAAGGSRDVIAGALACSSLQNDPLRHADDGWRGFHLSRYRALQQWRIWRERPDFEELFVPNYDDQDYVYWVLVDGQPTSCYGYDWTP